MVQLTKQAMAYVFDRATGRPIWPIEERPVPTSKTPGEKTARTQPFPTKPAPFDRHGLTTDDLIDFTPELRAEALEIAKRYVLGPIYTPPSVRGPGPNDTKGTLQMPGATGGAEWGGAGFDPETGIIYIPSITGTFAADLLPGDPKTHRPALHARRPRAGHRAPRTADHEAALRADRGDRPEVRRSPVERGQRRRSARPSKRSGISICRRSASRRATCRS